MAKASKVHVFTMPALSPTMERGTIVKWHKKKGDEVTKGVLMEVQTDKATNEYESPRKLGFLREILVKEGQEVDVGTPIALFTETADEEYEYKAPKKEEPKKEEAKVEKAGAKSPAATASAGGMQMPAFVPPPPPQKGFQFPTGELQSRVVASPLAKKMAKERGLDLTSVKGSGPGGRIVEEDLSRAQSDSAVSFARRAMPEAAAGTYEEEPLTPMRKIIGTRLQQSKAFIPHFYVRQEIDAQPLFEAGEQLKQGGLKITTNTFVLKAVAMALREHPKVNCGFNSVSQSIVRFKTIDISVAVAIDDGLITPIVRHADYKNLGELSVEVKELATRAKAGKLQAEEYQGGSFTISNLGMFGISDFVAVINPPQAAILAIAGIEECIRLKQGVVTAGKKMNLTLSADHRVIDGADAAKFLKSVQKYLENPALLVV